MSALLLAILLLGQIPGAPQETKQDDPPMQSRDDHQKTTRVVLRNGLTVILREESALPLASVVTHVKAGYFDEDDRISGIAHVLEHMLFKGTTRRGVGAIALETKALGGSLNAYTAYDRTVYHTVGPSENLARFIDIQADALWNSKFDEAELAREIEVVIQENNRKLDNPQAVASEKLYTAAFDQHRIRRWRIGTPEGLRALKREDVAAFHARFYKPSNIVLSIAGRMNREAILDEVIRLYGGATDSAVERDAGATEPAQSSMRYAWQKGPIDLPRLALGFHVSGLDSPEEPALRVLATMIGTGRGSHLQRFVRDEKARITSGDASVMSFPGFGYLEIGFEAADPVAGWVGVLAELETMRKSELTDEEVARAKAILARDHFEQFETVDGLARALALEEARGDWQGLDRRFDGLLAVTAEDVTKVLAKYLTRENMTVFEYLPIKVARTWSTADFEAAVFDKVPAEVEPRTGVELPVTTRLSRPADGVEQDLVKPIRKFSILRGPEVFVIEDHRLPIVSFGIFYPGGRLYESARNAGITELMLRTSLRGTLRFGSADIARRLENSGARIHLVNEPDFFGYVIEGLSSSMEQPLEVLIELLQNPAFREDDLESEKRLQLAAIERVKDNAFAQPVQLLMKVIFEEHAYGRPALGTAETVRALTRGDLDAWFKQNARSLIPVIVVAGDTHGSSLAANIADALTNDDLHSRDITTLPSPRLKETGAELSERTERKQTAIVVGFPTVSASSSERPALMLLQNLVGGMGGRFFDAIREKQGLAYTVQASSQHHARAGSFHVYTAASPENEAKVKQALVTEIEKLRATAVTAEEFRRALTFTASSLQLRLQSRTGQVLEHARAFLTGSGVSAVKDFPDDLARVTPELLRSLANVYLDPKKMRVAVVSGGPKP